MNDSIAKLYVVIGAKTGDLNRSLQGISNDLKKMGALMTGVGAVIVGSMSAITLKWATAGDQIAKLSAKTGMSCEALSELKYVADLSGSSLSGLETSLKRMQIVLIESKDATSAAGKALASLGLSYEELSSLAPEQQFERITSSLANVSDPTLKAALAVDIFGRSGTDLLPMLVNGSQGLADMRQEAHDLGVVFTAEAAKKAEAFKDSLTKLKTAVAGVGAKIGEALAPILTKLITTVTNVIKRITDWTQKHPALTKAITTVAFAIGVLTLAVGSFILACITIQRIAPAVGAAFHTMLGPIGLITGAISLLVTGVVLLISHWDDVVAFFKGPAAQAALTLKRSLNDLADNGLGKLSEVAQQAKSDIQSLMDFIQGEQYVGVELLSEDQIKKIRAISPEIADQLEAANKEISHTRSLWQEITDELGEARLTEIQIELGDTTKTKEEIAGLLDEKTRLEVEQRNKVLRDNATILTTALAGQLTQWDTYIKDIEDKWDGSVTYFTNVIIPALNKAMEEGLVTPDIVSNIIKQFEAAINLTPTTPPWWESLHPVLPFFRMFGLQQGGIATHPTLSMIGEAGPEAVIPLSKFSSLSGGKETHIHNHFGTFICDEMSLRKFGRMLEQVLKENDRRNFFGQVQSGYGTGTSSI
jgi:hypothetical protein